MCRVRGVTRETFWPALRAGLLRALEALGRQGRVVGQGAPTYRYQP